MKGSLKEYIEQVRDDIIHILAYSEVTIDYAEEDLPQDLVLQIKSKLQDLTTSLKSTLMASKSREGLMQGFKVAIVGKPNVGKSSLLAGIREANDEIERIGIERSLEAINESDIVVALFDGSREADGEDEQIIKLIKEHTNDKYTLHVENKIDLEKKFNNEDVKFDMRINSKDNVDELVKALENIMDTTNSSDEMMLISHRQISAVEETLQNIQEALFPLEDQELEIFSFHLNEAVKEMASITRPFENDEMLDKMFGSFCLGK